jgi:flagellar biosynthesis/type III secretory pathway chaperone
MQAGMNLAEALEQHFTLCQELHTLLLEESRILQTTQRPPTEAFLERKRELLPLLDFSLQAMRTAWATAPEEAAKHHGTIQRAQQKVLALMLLDRENEKLLLKHSFGTGISQLPAKPAGNLVRRAYASSAVAA